jgi:hypothetical protein
MIIQANNFNQINNNLICSKNKKNLVLRTQELVNFCKKFNCSNFPENFEFLEKKEIELLNKNPNSELILNLIEKHNYHIHFKKQEIELLNKSLNSGLRLEIIEKYNQLEKQQVIYAEKELEKIKQNYQLPVEERFNQLMLIEPKPTTTQAKIKHIQNILSLLYTENKFVQISDQETEIQLKKIQLRQEIQDHGGTINVINNRIYFHFPLDNEILSSVNGTNYLALTFKVNNLLKNNNIKNKDEQQKCFEILFFLMEKVDPIFRSYIKSALAFFQDQYLINFFEEIWSKCFDRIDQIDDWKLGKRVISTYCLIDSLIIDDLRLNYKCQRLNIDNFETNFDYYNVRKKINLFWLENKSKQQELYRLAYLKLNQLINNTKNKENFVDSKKNLLVRQDDTNSCHIFSEKTDLYSNIQPFDISTILPQTRMQSIEIKQETVKSKKSNQKSKKIKLKKNKQKQLKPIIDNQSIVEQKQELPIVQNVEIKSDQSSVQIINNRDDRSLVMPISISSTFFFKIAPRVNRWLEHPFGELLSKDKFPEYAHYSLFYQKLMHRLHGFSPVLFHQFYDVGIKTTWQNILTDHQDTCYLIPAEMQFSNQKIRGVISLAIDASGVCYHRYFKRFREQEILEKFRGYEFNAQDFIEKETDCQKLIDTFPELEINKRISQAFESVDYPHLQQAKKIKSPFLLNPYLSQKEEYKIDPVFGSVYLTDPEKEMTLVLFQVES